MDPKWDNKLSGAKWAGKKKGKALEIDMLGYLSELLDELLMDKQMVLSDAPGFEGPLGVYCKKNKT